MKIKIYQIDINMDYNGVCFKSYHEFMKLIHGGMIDSSIYVLTFDGDVECTSLEDAYIKFNTALPADYTGRSMTTSDVIYVADSDKHYYCDTVGFKEISFDANKAKENKITVVYLEPDKLAQVKIIENTLESMQKLVGGGNIETFYGIDAPCVIVCNDEGKLNGMTLNRSIRKNGKIVEVISGPFFICDASGPNFKSLSKELIDKYIRQFRFPELFFMVNNEICAIPYNPDKT